MEGEGSKGFVSTDSTVESQVVEIKDGKVVLTEKQMLVHTMSPEHFIGQYRLLQKTEQNILDALSDEARERIEADLEKTRAELERLRGDYELVDVYIKEDYDRKKLDGLVGRLREQLVKPLSEIKAEYLMDVWDNLRKNEPRVLELLSVEEKAKYLKVRVRCLGLSRGLKKG